MKITAPPYLSDMRRALVNSRRTFMFPTPMNMFAKPEPVAYRTGTPVAPAMALAISVLPVPGGPSKSDPVGRVAAHLLEVLEPLEQPEDLLGGGHRGRLPPDVVEGHVVLAGVQDVGVAARQEPEQGDELDRR